MKGYEICNRKSCTGCESCANSCPHQAIEMRTDWRGFRYPHVDSEKCTDCGVCRKQCPIHEKIEPFAFGKAYAFQEKDKTYLHRASSGGAFGVIARHVLQRGGIVFGASMDNDYRISYKAVENVKDLKLLHGSKYVQSYVGDAYKRVRECLRQGRTVLFCGCPCQVAGLKAFLRKDYENLVTMDLICHGVPSQPYFRAYVKDLLEHKKQTVREFRFRGKPSASDRMEYVHIGFINKDYYMTYFLWGKGYRSGCYRCKFAGGERQGDFTIGDFWNNKVVHLPINEEQGVSLVLVNTPKSEQMETVFATNGSFFPLKSIGEAIGKDGGQLKHPSKYDFRCDLIYILYKMFGLNGPKTLFKLDNLRFKLKKWV